MLVTAPDLPDEAAAMVARTPGRLRLLSPGLGLCVIHRDMGASQLPATCRYFPRLAVRDRRTFITLTHCCPTAAAMLFRDDRPLEIVEDPPAFPAAKYEGLVIAPDDWPPLHPRMLMDHEATAWERHMVARCAADATSPEDVVATLERDARILRRYRPDAGPIDRFVASLPADAVAGPMPSSLADSLRAVRRSRRGRARRHEAASGRKHACLTRTAPGQGRRPAGETIEAVSGQQGVRIMDGVSRPWHFERGAWTGSGARARQSGSGAPVPQCRPRFGSCSPPRSLP